MPPNNYVIRVLKTWAEIDASEWNALAQNSSHEPLGPFMRHEYLAALHDSGSAVPQTGWGLRLLTLWQGEQLAAACPVYLKTHSYGEYVFDWAWANAYQQHGLSYYPKALVASPFTPVPGPRLLALDDDARLALVQALLAWCQQEDVSSLHLLFLSPQDLVACQRAGLMHRQTVQFHWHNRRPNTDPGLQFGHFDEFLASLSQDKRKKIRQERRKVADAGVVFRWARGRQISPTDWDFFYRCYERTYLEHGNAPYLSRDFFARLAHQLPEQWLLFVAERQGRPIASSLIGLSQTQSIDQSPAVAYGRYWGALERVDCLHFEACYYQPLEWCIRHGVLRFEGGAQGEHKMARALMPAPTHSAHWLAHPAFADAVERFLEREQQGVEGYLAHLQDRSPFRQV
jgi:predicted N-acyltransferase